MRIGKRKHLGKEKALGFKRRHLGRCALFLIALPHNRYMQEKTLQNNPATEPVKLKADIMPSEKPALKNPALSAEGQRRLNNELLESAESGDNTGIETLLKLGASIEAKGGSGMTPLMHAARNGHTQTCALLLGKGASIEAKNNDGWTPLSMASQSRHDKIRNILESMPLLYDLMRKEASNSFIVSFSECVAG